MITFSKFNCFGMAAAAATLALCVSVQAQSGVNPPNVSPSGAGSQNAQNPDRATGAPGAQQGANSPDALNNVSATTAPPQKAMDKAFVRKMIMGNHAEIDSGNLAVQKGSSDDVKKFGQKMVDDHTKLLNDMTQLADQLHIKAPQSASPKEKAMAAKMSALSGDAFDKAYVNAMVKDHKHDVAEATKESNSAQIPEVKDAAQKALPTLKEHLQMIEGIQKNMKSSGGATASK